MKNISIVQLQDVTGMSYPTALAFAKEHGKQDANGGGRAKWLVPTLAVRKYVMAEKSRVDEMVTTLQMYETTPAKTG